MNSIKIKPGFKFSRLTVINKIKTSSFLCDCECGSTITVQRACILSNKVKSCGCLFKKIMSKSINLVGTKINRLLITERFLKNNSTYFKYRCDCGTLGEVSYSNITKGGTKSCGCLASELKTTHNMTNTPEYKIWTNIKSRCYNKKRPQYKHYGGRGITMSSEWKNSFALFYKDMGKRPSADHQIDRLNNDGCYEKNNCHWIYKKEQSYKRRFCANKTSKYRGVCFSKSNKKWVAQISKDKIKYMLGFFVTEKEAALAYNARATEFFGMHAIINLLQE